MFTGIVEEIGELRSRDGHRFVFTADVVLEGSDVDDSIAVSGTCLTVVDRDEKSFTVDVVDETLAKTTLDDLQPGDAVNLERPVRLADRLSGHIVQGHVDGVGEVVTPGPNMCVSVPSPLHRYIIDKGSVTVDGVSLTVVNALDDGFTVALIPHTLVNTILGNKAKGSSVNVEVDQFARYVERILSTRA